MTARALVLILLLPVTALGESDSGDHDPPPLPSFVRASAATPCRLDPEERARVLWILDSACLDDVHACDLARQVRGAICPDAHRLPVILLGLGMAMMLGFLLWLGGRADQ